MSERHTELVESLKSIIGSDHVTDQPELQIDESRAILIARPGSAAEVADCLKVCSEHDAAVVPAGRMTWLECGNPRKRADVVISLERMDRVIHFSAPDLTATVEAGLTLNRFNDLMAREREWLPLDPPGLQSASLGAIAACNSSGALRLGFGTARDYVIGLKLAHADGTESKSGGQVVKNVAGYDMNKLYVGSYGTLAIITELTFKLRPVGERASTMMISSTSRGPLLDLARRVLASELQPVSVVFSKRLPVSHAQGWPEESLLIRFINSEEAVEHQLNEVRRALDKDSRATALTSKEADAVWSSVADFDRQDARVRLSVPLLVVPVALENALMVDKDCVAAADIGAGIIRIAFNTDPASAVDKINRLRAATVGGGSLVIERAALEVRRQSDAWGEIGSTSSLMRAIKYAFDPKSLLNPGMFVSGI